MSSYVEVAPGQNEALIQGPKDVELGRWEPIENIEDPYVQEMGRFSVMEHNKQTGANLKFIRVVNGEKQVVAGINYRLRIEARNEMNLVWTYEAMVNDRPWEKKWKLIYFVPLLKN
ncbi:cysteine proteinase inhibitor 5-like [Benincasa hispida]|uniref:cysteine proteinase inhibitor 5-like n=1 Tax=Benincasa hispida TaxID=102211 RepID=UPI001901E738|nr:cysteine proteinase inhibitor 5-like [Benincasa hispida]